MCNELWSEIPNSDARADWSAGKVASTFLTFLFLSTSIASAASHTTAMDKRQNSLMAIIFTITNTLLLLGGVLLLSLAAYLLAQQSAGRLPNSTPTSTLYRKLAIKNIVD